MITFQREKLNKKLCAEILPLLKASSEEVYKAKENLTLYNSMKLDNIIEAKVNFNFYLKKESEGMLNICTIRDSGKLVGHWTLILNYHAQTMDLLIAETQNIHVLKEYRGLNSIKFMKFTEEVLKKRGVKLIYMAINPNLKQDKLMNHIGFTIDEIVFSKGI